MKSLNNGTNKKFVKFYNQYKNEQGITLLSLVITVIVLIIVSAIVISTVAGENGIISLAKKEKQKVENKVTTVENRIDRLENELKEGRNTTGGSNSTNNTTGGETQEKNWYLEQIWTNNAVGDFKDVVNTSDGGYIAVGSTTQAVNGVANKGGTDALVVKFNKSGDIQWQNTIGGSRNECFNGVAVKTDGTGYVAAGNLYSVDAEGLEMSEEEHLDDEGLPVRDYNDEYIPPCEGLYVEYDLNGNEVSRNITGSTYNACEGSLSGGPLVNAFTNIYFEDVLALDNNTIIAVGYEIYGGETEPEAFRKEIIFVNSNGTKKMGEIPVYYYSNAEISQFPVTDEELNFSFETKAVNCFYNNGDVYITGTFYNYALAKYNVSSGKTTLYITGGSFGETYETMFETDTQLIISSPYCVYKFDTSLTEDYISDLHLIRNSSRTVWYNEILTHSILKRNNSDLAAFSDSSLRIIDMETGKTKMEFSIPRYNKAILLEEDNFVLVGNNKIAKYTLVYK